MDWAQILVIILAIVLAVFLILAIVLVSLLIKVTTQIKNVTGSAQRTAEHFEHIFAGASKMTTPMFLIRMVLKQVRKIKKKR